MPKFFILSLALVLALNGCHDDKEKPLEKKISSKEGPKEAQKCPEKSGWSGPNCDICSGNYWGPNCDQAPTCKNGTASLGLTGNGECLGECNGHFAGKNCDVCADGYKGSNCEEPSNCPPGFSGDKCDECSPNFFGPNCQPCPNCGHGACADGKDGLGNCQCQSGWQGANCNACAPAWTGPNCNELRAIVIDGQSWMPVNMDTEVARDGSAVVCNSDDESDEDFVSHYGCLYNWTDAKKVCPNGWHLPAFNDFAKLRAYVESHKTSNSLFLALIAKTGWQVHNEDGYEVPITGGDDFSFRALPAGFQRDAIHFDGLSMSANFWTTTKSYYEVDHANYVVLEDGSYDTFILPSKYGLSARCIKDYSCGPHGEWHEEYGCKCQKGWSGYKCDKCAINFTGANCSECASGWSGENGQCNKSTFTDQRDNTTYAVVAINDQIWLGEHLRYAGSEAAPVTSYETASGRLYPLETALTVCPEGWHLPTSDEFDDLMRYVDFHAASTDNLSALITKTGWQNFIEDDITGSDLFDFAVLPSGYYRDEELTADKRCTILWSATADKLYLYEDQTYYALQIGSCSYIYDDSGVFIDTHYTDEYHAVRCIKN